MFDWNAFDNLDWKGIKREKNEYYGLEHSNLAHLGEGLNKLCADKDYKAALDRLPPKKYDPWQKVRSGDTKP